MQPVNFEGASVIRKPKDMTDEQCMSIWAKHGFIDLTTAMEEFEAEPPPHYINIDQDSFMFFVTAWKPSYEDLKALNRGEPIYIKTIAQQGLPPMSVFTINENGESNDAD